MEITAIQQRCVEAWLKLSPHKKKEHCPFRVKMYNGGDAKDGLICRKMLPEIAYRPGVFLKICEAVCPCSVLSVKEVERRARKILEECC